MARCNASLRHLHCHTVFLIHYRPVYYQVPIDTWLKRHETCATESLHLQRMWEQMCEQTCEQTCECVSVGECMCVVCCVRDRMFACAYTVCRMRFIFHVNTMAQCVVFCVFQTRHFLSPACLPACLSASPVRPVCVLQTWHPRPPCPLTKCPSTSPGKWKGLGGWTDNN
jgi:hypothetical protein